MFKRAEDRYVIEWPKNPAKREIYEVQVSLPKLPDEKLIKNHNLPSKKQFYASEVVPDDIASWPKDDIAAFAAAQWHRRMNGEWQFINGKPYYIPGGAIPFFDFWTLESGKKPEFRYSALKLFTFFYLFVEPSPDIYGIYNVKPRRVGDTANFLYLSWERTARFKGVRAGLQSYKDDMAEKTFARVAKGARGMPFFFRPNRAGSDKSYIAYMAPNEVHTMKRLRQAELEAVYKNVSNEEFLGSFMDYEATVTGAYDGEQLFTVFMDEVLKIKPHQMNAVEQWKNLRRCLSLFNEDVIYGKGFVSSTVEKKKSLSNVDAVSTLEVAEWFWDNSDPADLNSEYGRTPSGLVRIFRNYKEAAKPDKYGFPQAERASAKREMRIKQAMDKGDTEAVYYIFRKEPGSIEEALIEDNENCPLYPEICQIALKGLKHGIDRFGEVIPDYRKPWVEGDLKWRNGRPNTEVIFVPRPGGPWHISQQPHRPNNVEARQMTVRDEMGRLKNTVTFIPKNATFFRLGSDPISSNPRILGKGSKGAITVKRRLDLDAEPKNLKFDEHGIVTNPEDMVTNQIVGDYIGRPYKPEDFFKEIVKACFYWGAPVMLEMDKHEAYLFMAEHGYYGFIMSEPETISSKRGRKKRPAPGVRSAGDIVGTYVTALQSYIANYWPAIKHPRVLSQCSKFVTKKRTKFDAVVSWGMAEIADMDHRYKDAEDTAQKEWEHNPYEIA